MKGAINQFARRAVSGMAASYGSSIVKLVSETVRGWDARTITDRLEAAVGRDLQYIRINGTLVGGLVGLVLHALDGMLNSGMSLTLRAIGTPTSREAMSTLEPLPALYRPFGTDDRASLAPARIPEGPGEPLCPSTIQELRKKWTLSSPAARGRLFTCLPSRIRHGRQPRLAGRASPAGRCRHVADRDRARGSP